MKTFVFLPIILSVSSPLLAADKPYRCKDFVSDATVFNADKSITWQEMGTDFSQATGIIVGVYFGRSGEPYNYGSQGFQAFQNAVFAECKTQGAEKVAVIALRIPIAKKITAAGAYEKISMTDLQLDITSMKGRRVEVTGTLQAVGEIAMISSEVLDMNKIFVETKTLPRESRKYILENCGSGCDITLRGRVTQVMLNPGINAEQITPQ